MTSSKRRKMMLQIYLLIRRATRWFLRNGKPNIDIEKTIETFREPIKELIIQLPTLLTEYDLEEVNKEIAHYVELGVPEKLARSIANCNTLFTSLDIVEAARKHDAKVIDVAKIYYALGTHLELNWLRDHMDAYPMETQWDELARSGFRDDLDRVQRKLSMKVLTSKAKKVNGKSIEERIQSWQDQTQLSYSRWQTLIADMKSSTNVGLVTYSVILRELFDFAEAG